MPTALNDGVRLRYVTVAMGTQPAKAVSLDFRLEARRQVDLDNLVRPVLAGLRDAGMFKRGFSSLDLLVATKIAAPQPGLVIVTDVVAVWRASTRPREALLHASSPEVPRDGDHRRSKAAWRALVADAFEGPVVPGAWWVDIATNATRSLEGIMKPVIDGLEPFLGWAKSPYCRCRTSGRRRPFAS